MKDTQAPKGLENYVDVPWKEIDFCVKCKGWSLKNGHECGIGRQTCLEVNSDQDLEWDDQYLEAWEDFWPGDDLESVRVPKLVHWDYVLDGLKDELVLVET